MKLYIGPESVPGRTLHQRLTRSLTLSAAAESVFYGIPVVWGGPAARKLRLLSGPEAAVAGRFDAWIGEECAKRGWR